MMMAGKEDIPFIKSEPRAASTMSDLVTYDGAQDMADDEREDSGITLDADDDSLFSMFWFPSAIHLSLYPPTNSS